jgi:hypothetical protein
MEPAPSFRIQRPFSSIASIVGKPPNWSRKWWPGVAISSFASLHSTTIALSETSAFTGEVTGGTYLRQEVTASFPGATNGAAANDVAIEFTLMPATTVYTFCIATSSSAGGQIVWQTTLTASKTLGLGDTLRFAIGEVTGTST